MKTDAFMARVSLNILNGRLRAKLSLRKLAARCGVSAGNLCKIERNRQNVTLETLHKIATALNLRVNDLLP